MQVVHNLFLNLLIALPCHTAIVEAYHYCRRTEHLCSLLWCFQCTYWPIAKHACHWPVAKRVISEWGLSRVRGPSILFEQAYLTAGSLSKRGVIPQLSSTSVHVTSAIFQQGVYLFIARPQNKCSFRHVCCTDSTRRLFIHVGEKSSGHETV